MSTERSFIAVDGDSVGRKIENLIISGELDKLASYSHSINEAINYICLLAETCEGKIYLKGGDNILVEMVNYHVFLEQFLPNRAKLNASFSVGIGRNVVEAYLGLKFAKSAGRGLIIVVESINGKFDFKQII